MNRSKFLTASATAVAASGAVAAVQGAAGAQAVPGGSHLVERKADFDYDAFAKIVGRDAQIRQLFQISAFKPAVLNNIKNAFNGLQFGFGYPAGSIAIAFCPHGPSAAYTYSDYVWKKYRIGEFDAITDADGKTIESNIYFPKTATVDLSASPDDEKGMYQDKSIEMLQQRGLIVLTCHTAVEEQSRAIVKKGLAPAGMTPSQVADDILTHLIPGAVVVPAMVAAVAVLQANFKYVYETVVL